MPRFFKREPAGGPDQPNLPARTANQTNLPAITGQPNLPAKTGKSNRLHLPSIPKTPAFGVLLRNHRLTAGMTVEQLAEAAGMAPSAIRAIESDTVSAPADRIIKLLADAMHLGADERDGLELAALLNSPMIRALNSPAEPAKAGAMPLAASILAFLIADVRGYTHFTQEHGDAAAARLTERFAEVARAALERWDGRLVELRGDEALAVFGSVRQALAGALDMQTRFAEATRAQPDLPLEVGIGLDVGEAMQLDEGYRGAALNRAARLCSRAAAGEVLVTTGLIYVAPKVDGVAFVERGQVELKGFDGAIEVMAVVPAAS